MYNCHGNVGVCAAAAHPAARSWHDGSGHADKGEIANFELQAVDHSTDGTNDKLCFAVPIIPRGIHVIKDHVNPRGIMMRKHSLECFYSSGDRGFVY
jgi:hypothetical protein